MTSELFLDVQPNEVSIALLEDKNLVELQKENLDSSFSVGNVYLGKIKKLMPGLNACFVDVGYEKDAFLHYQDLGVQFNTQAKYLKQVLSDRKTLAPISKAPSLPDIPKEGTLSDLVKVGQEVLVQIVKEPISTKGPRLTSEISIAGRYLVLIPFGEKVSVSQKIKSNEERIRLKQLIQSIKPARMGIIVRTVAEGKRVAELDNELKVLMKYWEDCILKVQKSSVLPVMVHEETSRTVAMLRDLFNPSFENIYINNKDTYEEIKNYVSLIAPEKQDIVKLYEGRVPIFDNFSITKQIKSLFGRTVSYRNGAYLIIEQTEAMHVVDVNSGNRSKQNNGQEETLFTVTMEGADVTAQSTIYQKVNGKSEVYEGLSFKSSEAGKYVFFASYQGKLTPEITIEAVANKGFELKEIKVNNSPVQAENGICKVTITGITTISATFDEVVSINNVQDSNVYYNSENQTLYTDSAKSIVICDLTGRIVLKARNKKTVNLSNLAEGIYTAIIDNTELKFRK